jgi:putative alpha-1,2-mannosidase
VSKTAALVKQLSTLFDAGEEGYPGDEDNGSMSAWYIFATIGKFPVCPGSGKWALTTPLAKFKILGE